MTITLFENLRAVFYAPFYATLTRGAAAAEGLAVRLVTSPSPAETASSLLDGTADVSWGGPMRVLLTYDRQPDCDLVLFAEAVTRDPFFLVGREPRPAFRFADLAALRLATVSEVPTPWLCLRQDIVQAGLDPAALDRIADRTMAANAQALRDGTVDVMQAFQPFVEELVGDGAGHVWYAAATRGPTAYTSFYTTRARLEGERETCAALTRALYRTLKWLADAEPAAVAEAIAEYFPAIAPGLLAACIARYQALGIWNRDPVLPRQGFERLKSACLAGGLIARDTPYEVCVDTTLAEAALAADPPAV